MSNSPRYIDAYFNTMNGLVNNLAKAYAKELDENGCTPKLEAINKKRSQYDLERFLGFYE